MIYEVTSAVQNHIFIMSLCIFSHSSINAQVTVFLKGQVRNPSPQKILLSCQENYRAILMPFTDNCSFSYPLEKKKSTLFKVRKKIFSSKIHENSK